MHTTRAALLGTVAATLVTFGCQVLSASITSPSDSISGTGHAIGGSLESISRSSGSGADEGNASYERDMRQYTASFVHAGGRTEDFAPGATRIAAGHGISNWEADSKTADAVGAGLADAKQSEAQARAFCSSQGFSSDLSKQIVLAAKKNAG
jgi:hypothetical protein